MRIFDIFNPTTHSSKDNMPFTFSHPAIVLPLACLPKQWFSLTGLIIGSVAPDFEYFLRMRIESNYSHTFYGLLWLVLPLGIFLAFIFHNIVRNVLFENLPRIVQVRIFPFRKFAWNRYFKANWPVVIFSVIIGAASHIFWDSFTHADGYFVTIFPDLKSRIEVFQHQIPVFKILQHTSSFIGGLAILFAVLNLPATGDTTVKPDLRYWGILLLLTIAIIAVRIMAGLDFKQYGNMIVTAISAILISLILTPVLLGKETIFKT